MTRLNITLPQKTINLLERAAPKGSRSRFIADAIENYLNSMGRNNIRALLKDGALRRAERDQQLTEEWFLIDEKTWPNKKN